MEKVCKNCKLIYDIDECPVCGKNEYTTSYAGYIIIKNPEKSEIAKLLGAKVPGRYVVRTQR